MYSSARRTTFAFYRLADESPAFGVVHLDRNGLVPGRSRTRSQPATTAIRSLISCAVARTF